MGTDPYADDLTGRIDAAIAEVYRTESLSRAESHGAMRALGAFGAPAVDRVLELYRGSTTGPHEHARLLNGLGTSAVDAQAAARRAVARACPHRYVERLAGRLEPTDISVVAEIHDPRVSSLLISLLDHRDGEVRSRATTALRAAA